MMEHLSPVIDQLNRAEDDRARAGLLLSAPDNVILLYADTLKFMCRRVRFTPGELFVDLRRAMLCAVRDRAGLLPAQAARELEQLRADMASFAAGARANHAHLEAGDFPAAGPPAAS